MSSDFFFVCFQSGRCDLDQIRATLEQAKVLTRRFDDHLVVIASNGAELAISLNQDRYVAEENAEIAGGDSVAQAFLPCDARFEVHIDDWNAIMMEYHTLFLLQECLVKSTGGFLFLGWNGAILDFNSD
ncbi:hypothetical protein [Tuwongella immobilis]|uniref:Uncharacterized protein n=1 Tax=Tuwongella immobilis TaxID=692036 RepID=A0A6C2YUP7_9BACT|nr:hypothetical protein [Tuwongella immobilis]VIP05077.1 Uncharacterized protein OS=Acinetobacter haemolyticus ATCC 19194 GN=HMP0015_3196 PE=4 SV=1 [Tuwongella immobilis]VTS07510.1 Uncharacterized protein OS=Acinetobacter haemolyticus ATCC 19194 GN=HMP0015_3196 PE=4 SV=1 [Tuwongella immobilis]